MTEIGAPAHRLTPNDAPTKVGERTRRFKLSDSSVALDGHTLATDGWDLSRAANNLPVLWAHDAETVEHVLGQWENVHVEGDSLLADAVFMPGEINPTADMVLNMIDGGFLRMCSVGFVPTDGKPSKRGPGTFDFSKQTLLEASIVPVGSLASALVQARDAGIDISPARDWAKRNLELGMDTEMERGAGGEWKCGASRDLPLDEDSAWDGAAAAKSVFDACGFDGDKPDTNKARKAFLAYDASNPTLKGSYKLPFAKMSNGRMTAVLAGVHNAAARLSNTQISDEAKKSAQSVIDGYESKSSKGKDNSREAPVISKRGLYLVAQLAYALSQLDCLTEASELEAEQEGDDSPVPGMLQDSLKALGAALIAMTEEEVAELLSEDQDEGPEMGAYSLLMSADADTRGALIEALRDAANGKSVSITTTRGLTQVRAGKRISKETRETLASAHEHMRCAMRHVSGLLERDADSEDDGGDGTVEQAAEYTKRAADERARRERLAKALQEQIA